ncbi:MAG TPA: energy-coupling factor transporter ATPase [Candidatus Avilachnospira avistercoris]|nr:energy-coupling factor transporter ATPase [Candidatus Avilachnospira avistercoris]
MNIIEAKDVLFEYVQRDENNNIEEVNEALSDMSLSIEKGSFVCILGHNGSGKSTFAKLLNALCLPKEGTVLISGMDTKDESRLLDIRKSCGMVFQNPDNQIIANVVEEDVAFGPENMGVPTDEIIRRVDEALEKVGMTAYRFKSPNRLSGGQKQRVAIAGVMAMKPECIVLDEPTAMLDPSGRRDVIATIHELNKKEGITIVHITHYMEEACDADRVIVMDGGHVVMDDVPRKIFSRVEELKELALGVPQITELGYELRNAGVPIPLGILTREELCQYLIPLFKKKGVGPADA